MKITKQQELDHIVSIAAGLLASGDFTYTRRDNNGAAVHSDLMIATHEVWGDIKLVSKVEISDENPESSLASQPGGTLKTEARKGK